MVLRSGIIIPFQFREQKKLLMIGGSEENRDLSIWDLKNVVRAAFGIYNFEFRNKKIGFIIPDELLLNYLEQRHDLTNFVIEIGQSSSDVIENSKEKENLSFEPSCSQMFKVLLPQKSNENSADSSMLNATVAKGGKYLHESVTNHSSSSQSSINNSPHKLRISQVFSEQVIPDALSPTIDPLAVIPKTEQSDGETERRRSRFDARPRLQHLQYFQNYGPNMLSHRHDHSSHQYAPSTYNRFRRRGERMSKDQKELYVKYFEENPCMLTQRRNDVILEPHWQKLCSLLNNVPQGAMKNVEEWKQTFDAWRYRVFMYTRYNSKLTGLAAQNPKNYKPLTATDQRAYVMWTSHKNTAPQDFEKMDVFANLDDTNNDFDY